MAVEARSLALAEISRLMESCPRIASSEGTNSKNHLNGWLYRNISNMERTQRSKFSLVSINVLYGVYSSSPSECIAGRAPMLNYVFLFYYICRLNSNRANSRMQTLKRQTGSAHRLPVIHAYMSSGTAGVPERLSELLFLASRSGPTPPSTPFPYLSSSSMACIWIGFGGVNGAGLQNYLFLL